MVPDVGAPLAVTAVDLVTEATAPNWNEWLSYLSVGAGYISGIMGWGGDFMKNYGIASFPWAAKNVYSRVKGGVDSEAKKLAYRATQTRSRVGAYQPINPKPRLS